MVQVTGDVTVCCLDEHLENKIGNLQETPLAELWHGETMDAWRRAHLEGRFEDSGPLCTRCNWKSAGAAPEDAIRRWLDRIRDTELMKAWQERRKKS